MWLRAGRVRVQPRRRGERANGHPNGKAQPLLAIAEAFERNPQPFAGGILDCLAFVGGFDFAETHLLGGKLVDGPRGSAVPA
jgi:hypothetical protein